MMVSSGLTSVISSLNLMQFMFAETSQMKLFGKNCKYTMSGKENMLKVYLIRKIQGLKWRKTHNMVWQSLNHAKPTLFWDSKIRSHLINPNNMATSMSRTTKASWSPTQARLCKSADAVPPTRLFSPLRLISLISYLTLVHSQSLLPTWTMVRRVKVAIRSISSLKITTAHSRNLTEAGEQVLKIDEYHHLLME